MWTKPISLSWSTSFCLSIMSASTFAENNTSKKKESKFFLSLLWQMALSAKLIWSSTVFAMLSFHILELCFLFTNLCFRNSRRTKVVWIPPAPFFLQCLFCSDILPKKKTQAGIAERILLRNFRSMKVVWIPPFF